MSLGRELVFLLIVAAPFVVGLVTELKTRLWGLAFSISAAALPALLLISVAVSRPSALTEWQITLVLAIIWGTLSGAFGTLMGFLLTKKKPTV